jgi:hypothetical protein
MKKRNSYYDVGGIETIEIIKAKLTVSEYIGFLKGNVIKYLCRAGYKDITIQDYEKAREYLGWLIDFTAGLEDGRDIPS